MLPTKKKIVPISGGHAPRTAAKLWSRLSRHIQNRIDAFDMSRRCRYGAGTLQPIKSTSVWFRRDGLCADIGAGMCIDIRIDMHVDMCTDICVGESHAAVTVCSGYACAQLYAQSHVRDLCTSRQYVQ